mgnify:FL=1|jgi:hypothetical protein
MEAKFLNKFQQFFTQLNLKINNFTNFVVKKLKNYKNLSLGEQIAYPTIGFGILLILVSLILFIL